MSKQFEYDRQAKIREQAQAPADADLGINVPTTIHSLICLCGKELSIPDLPGIHDIPCGCGERWQVANLPRPVALDKRGV